MCKIELYCKLGIEELYPNEAIKIKEWESSKPSNLTEPHPRG